jgi:hypothetical protein
VCMPVCIRVWVQASSCMSHLDLRTNKKPTPPTQTQDIVGQLLAKGATGTSDFEWQMQLRYYWEADDLAVRQAGGGLRFWRGRAGASMAAAPGVGPPCVFQGSLYKSKGAHPRA